jgi:REP element-mobilizing transposase RayT
VDGKEGMVDFGGVTQKVRVDLISDLHGMIRILLEENSYYHIYNHGIGAEKIFLKDQNYRFFLKQLKAYIDPLMEIYAYCLLPNHFHLLIKTKILNQIELDLKDLKISEKHPFSKQFSKLFSSYTQAFNKQNLRMGGLFIRDFKRKKANDLAYVKNLIEYIHFNPVKHQLTEDIKEWKFSSYNDYVYSNTDIVNLENMISFYGNLEIFIQCHNKLKIFPNLNI